VRGSNGFQKLFTFSKLHNASQVLLAANLSFITPMQLGRLSDLPPAPSRPPIAPNPPPRPPQPTHFQQLTNGPPRASLKQVKLLAILLAPLAVALAQPGDLEQLLREALSANPEVLAAQKRYEAARQRPTQSSSLPDPVFSPSFNSNGRPWPGAALGTEPTSNIGFMVSQEVPFPGKRKLAGDLATKDAEAAWQQYLQVKLSLVSRFKQA
jgi:outer membrane protein TolC